MGYEALGHQMSYFGAVRMRKRLFVGGVIAVIAAWVWVFSHLPDDAQSQTTPENTVSTSAAPVESTREKEDDVEAASRELWEAGTSPAKMANAYQHYAQAQRRLNGPDWDKAPSPPIQQTTVDTSAPTIDETVGDAPAPLQDDANQIAEQ